MFGKLLLSALALSGFSLVGASSAQAQCGGGGFGGFGYGRSYGGYSGGGRGYGSGGYGYGRGCGSGNYGYYDSGPGYVGPYYGGYTGGPAPAPTFTPAPGMPNDGASRLPPAPPPEASALARPEVGAPGPVPAGDARSRSPKQQKIAATLAKLAPQDRVAAEKQKFCAVLKKNELGSMGVPIKLMLDGKPLFLCCPACLDTALERWPAAQLAEQPAENQQR